MPRSKRRPGAAAAREATTIPCNGHIVCICGGSQQTEFAASAGHLAGTADAGGLVCTDCRGKARGTLRPGCQRVGFLATSAHLMTAATFPPSVGTRCWRGKTARGLWAEPAHSGQGLLDRTACRRRAPTRPQRAGIDASGNGSLPLTQRSWACVARRPTRLPATGCWRRGGHVPCPRRTPRPRPCCHGRVSILLLQGSERATHPRRSSGWKVAPARTRDSRVAGWGRRGGGKGGTGGLHHCGA